VHGATVAYLLAALVAFGLSAALVAPIAALQRRAGLVAPNYCGDRVPAAGGVGVALAVLGCGPILLAAGAAGTAGAGAAPAATALFALATMGFLGLLDDVAGGGPRGFGGHFGALFTRARVGTRVGTGVLRAAWGGATALACALVAHRNPLDIALAALAAALAFNLVNLLDTRPGRAGKGYLAAVAVLVLARLARLLYLAGPHSVAALPAGATAAGPLVGVLGASALLPFLPADLAGRAMLGNAGSGALGAALGVALAWTAGRALLAFAVVAMAALHVFGERRSLGALIERTPVLRWIDGLGRGARPTRTPECPGDVRPTAPVAPRHRENSPCPDPASRKGVCREGGE